MDKRLIAGILVFGSLWGFSEVIIGTGLQNSGLPYGGIMTGVFALGFLVLSRMAFRRSGMQLGMGLVAGSLRMFNPFVGCHLCSAIAIMAEAAIFEIIWYNMDTNFKDLKSITMQSSIGITTAYLVYVGGYITTQVLTPILGGTGFYLQNLIVFMPRILASGLLPALLGAAVLPAILQIKKLDLRVKDRLYYPATLGISILCWITVIGFSIIGS
jgi:hypothetical protein